MPQTEIVQMIIDYGGLVIGWSVTLFRLTMLLDRKRRNLRSIKIWLFAVFLSLAATFELDTVYITVDRWSGLNNVSWLLAYLCLTTAIYFFCAFCAEEHPRWMLPGLILVGGCLAAVHPYGPGATPEWVEHIIPNNVGEIVFVGLAYSYVSALVTLVLFQSLVAVYRRSESRLLGRLRTSVGLAATVATVAFYVMKLGIFSLSFFITSIQPLVDPVTYTAKATWIAALLLWTMFFAASDSFYLTLARPVRFASKVLALMRLSALRTTIDRVVNAGSSPPGAARVIRLGQLDLHIYRSLIGILDSRRLLLALEEQQDRQLSPSNDMDMEKALCLSRALRNIPDSLDFDGLVRAYCHLQRDMGECLLLRKRRTGTGEPIPEPAP